MLVAGAAVAWPLAARAQQPARTIGLLGSGTASSQAALVVAFVERLSELGWIEGRNAAIEYRWAEGRPERFAEIAAEFVRLKVDIIFATGTEPALAAKQATAVIPIVFSSIGGPGRRRHRRKLGATGRQRHWPVRPEQRSCRQAFRDFARPDSQSRATVGKPDIFVHVDWMADSTHSHAPSDAAIKTVVDAFANAPYISRNGSIGINLHVGRWLSTA
jgi:hypothetical protein